MSTDSYYTRQLASPAYRASRERRAQLILAICAPFLPERGTIIDFGAGTGHIRAALERELGRPVFGIDIDRAFIENPRRMIVGDLEDLPLRNGCVDFGIANHVYEHVADLDGFFAAIAGALAPGGRVYLTAGSRFALIEPHYRLPTLSWWPRPIAERILRWSGRGDRYDDIRFTTHRRLVSSARRAGLAMDDVTDEVLASQLQRYESRVGRVVGRFALVIPRAVRNPALRWFSPQWYFFVRHGRAD